VGTPPEPYPRYPRAQISHPIALSGGYLERACLVIPLLVVAASLVQNSRVSN
jgi:hypothetical protein